jgi:hypothetical protein
VLCGPHFYIDVIARLNWLPAHGQWSPTLGWPRRAEVARRFAGHTSRNVAALHHWCWGPPIFPPEPATSRTRPFPPSEVKAPGLLSGPVTVNPAFTLIGATYRGHHPGKEAIMPVEMLTYAAIAERLGCSSEAARATR